MLTSERGLVQARPLETFGAVAAFVGLTQDRHKIARAVEFSSIGKLQRQEREEQMDQIRGERKAVDFGSQIRSYVLAPYQMVKDHRTEMEVGDPQRVLDGDLDAFMEAYLRG